MAEINVSFDPKRRTPGEIVEGTVLLNVPLLELRRYLEVHVKFTGSILVRIGLTTKRTTLFCDIAPIWKHFDLPSSDEHIAKVPFRFTLPSELFPTGLYKNTLDGIGGVGYYIQVTGTRPGTFKPDKHIFCPILVLTSNARGYELSKSLNGPWTGEWKTVEQRKDIRRYFRGGYASAAVAFSLPDIDVLPIHTPVPFTLKVTTFTKPMEYFAAEKGVGTKSSGRSA
ncbi:hypothetical protein PHLCEN_2v9558 [Hermanssonia centrifuga]|uniref:Arrestin-like N-terminal domain-containing protein n=1 Tax=Hermanssonia centrifuga TaxID=98765 RepID=A0A2R6NQM3_9APHY|nr:hypothetical protein PHLCEN_2v9558 [Hermanssonia centrifuga]